MKSISIIGKVNGNIFSRQFESGAVQARVPVIVKESWKAQDGSESARETFFTVEVWNNTALFCANRFKDGDSIYVDGDLNMRSFTKRDGSFDARLVIAARKVLPIGNSDEANIAFRGIGNLTRDPEMRYTNEAGLPVTNARIAFNRRYLDSSGERQEETLFVDLVAWNNTAENLDQYTHEGSKLYIEADKMELDFYTSKEGEPRVNLEITANFTQFLSPRGDQGEPVAAEGAPAPEGDDDMPW